MSSYNFNVSSDRKVRFYSSQKNSFGLLPGPTNYSYGGGVYGSCSGCTTTQGGCFVKEGKKKTHTCYVSKLIKAWKSVYNALYCNTKLIKELSLEDKTVLFDEVFTKFSSNKKNAAPNNNYFRLFWSGDVVDIKTAAALVRAIEKHPEINFWFYTRSFYLVHKFVHLKNLVLYISLDKVNQYIGKVILECYNNITYAYMGDTNIFNAAECPVDSGRIELTHACSKCRMCLNKAPVWFKVK